MADDCRDYHSERARAEHDLALKASSADARRAHFRLSSLHLERARTPEPDDPLTQHRL